MLHEAIRNELTTSTVTAGYLAGVPDRVYPLVIPQKKAGGAAQTPCVVYRQDDVETDLTYCGVSGLTLTTMELNSYATSYDEAKQLAKAVRAVLSDYKGLLGGIVGVRAAKLETELDLDDPEPGLYRVMQTWQIWHEE